MRRMKLLQEFKEFAMKGSVIDLAVGVIIGAAFGAVVSSFVTNVMMPPLGWLVSGVEFEELSIDIPVGKLEAAAADVAETATDVAGAGDDAAAAGDDAADAADAAAAADTPEDVEAAADQVEQAADTVESAAAEVADATAEPDPETGTVGEGENKVVRIMYGKFLNDVIKFIIQAFAIFMVIRVMNKLNREKEQAADEPGPDQTPALSTEERLLTEIRDLMASGSKAPTPPDAD